jgi:hypothetical protein
MIAYNFLFASMNKDNKHTIKREMENGHGFEKEGVKRYLSPPE